jgi:predicted metalloprotease
MWGKALWRIYKIIVTIGIAVLFAVVAFWISMLIGCSSANAQSAYFHTSKDDIQKVAKKDGYKVSSEDQMIGETLNTIYYLTKDSIVIRVGYVPDMDKPAFIHYREEN